MQTTHKTENLSNRYIIQNGRVIDPRNGIDEVTDIVIESGVIAALGTGGDRGSEAEIIDASGKLVMPGLIDLHAHVYKGVSSYGLDPDRAGVHSGVTHVNDVGSTGWLTLGGFQTLVAAGAETDVTCFPNILPLGLLENWLVGVPELARATLRPDLLQSLAERHPDLIRGVKVHIERGVMSHLDGGSWRTYEATRDVADALGMHIYVHLGDLFPQRAGASLEDPHELPVQVVERMRPGDVLGHCFTHHAGGLVDEQGNVSPAAKLARDRGVKHEVGHGLNFSFYRARCLLDAGILPDIISSDIHGPSMHAGRVLPERGLDPDIEALDLSWSMVGTMSKVLALGVPLPEVVRMSTLEPARALRLDDRKGSLTVGHRAEITVLDTVEGDFRLVDSEGKEHPATELLLPWRTFIGQRTWPCRPLSLPEFRNEYLAVNPALDELVSAVA